MANAGRLAPKLNVEGVVSDYVRITRSNEEAIQFTLKRDEGHPIAVVMTGEKVTGVIADGHRVALLGPEPEELDQLEDKTLYPLMLKNTDTGGVVKVFRPGLRRKALRAGISTLKDAWGVVIGVLVA